MAVWQSLPPGGGPGGFVLTIHQEETPEGYISCRPVGELDAFTVSQFRQALSEMASSKRLLIDMSGIPFVDSAGLGALVGGTRRPRGRGGDWGVGCTRPTRTRLCPTTGFQGLIRAGKKYPEAAAALEGNVPVEE